VNLKQRFLILSSLLLVAFAPFAQADNGQVAFAYPTDPLKIDGNLDDWPKSLPTYPIVWRYSGTAEDFNAHFRAAYSIKNKSLYIAVEVTDDVHVVDEKTQQEWRSQDSHLLYVDPYHEVTGSGPLLYVATGPHRKTFDQSTSWDPRMTQTNWDQCEVQVSRQKNKTIYEWRMGLGDLLIPGNTLGIDHFLTDKDPDDPGNAGSIAFWGNFSGKSQRAARLGDLILLKPGADTGTLEGDMGWVKSVEGPELKNSLVRIQAVDNPGFWVQSEADAKGHYRLEFPVGRYKITSPFKLYGNRFQFRLKDSIGVVAAVKKNTVTQAPLLEFDVKPPPALLEKEGLLFHFDKKAADRLDHWIKAYMDYFQIPGVSLALLKDHKLVYHKFFGVKNVLTQAPVDENTLFEAGSITKIIFAFAVNRLAQRGVIDLDKPLYQYLSFPAIAHDERFKKITARHVLHHRTGFPNWAFLNDDGKLDIKFEPGSKFGYSGEGYEYLGRVVAHITGKDLETILKEETLQPAGISKRMGFVDHGDLAANFALGHDMTRPNKPFLPNRVGVAYSMHTEAKTLSKFMQLLMNKKGLSKAGYEAMYEPFPGNETSFDRTIADLEWKVRFGLGFSITDTPYGRAIGHSGSNNSQEALFEFYEKHRMGFIVFTNSDVGREFYLALRKFLIVGQPLKDL